MPSIRLARLPGGRWLAACLSMRSRAEVTVEISSTEPTSADGSASWRLASRLGSCRRVETSGSSPRAGLRSKTHLSDHQGARHSRAPRQPGEANFEQHSCELFATTREGRLELVEDRSQETQSIAGRARGLPRCHAQGQREDGQAWRWAVDALAHRARSRPSAATPDLGQRLARCRRRPTDPSSCSGRPSRALRSRAPPARS
jgi:hypothetical protein